MEDETWTEADDAMLIHAALPANHPSAVVREFFSLLSADPMNVEALIDRVDPASLDGWGDFTASRAFAAEGAAISHRALRIKNEPAIAYVKLTPDSGAMVSKEPRTDAKAYVTLIWNPKTDTWRLYSIGDAIHPSATPARNLSHGATYDTDAHIEFDNPVL
ncbi:hypothetical protein ACWPKO_19615 (plasmid) [Coraliomargarita sp. W4R53]